MLYFFFPFLGCSESAFLAARVADGFSVFSVLVSRSAFAADACLGARPRLDGGASAAGAAGWAAGAGAGRAARGGATGRRRTAPGRSSTTAVMWLVRLKMLK